MNFIDVLISMVYGIVEGITEWLPISSTGHLILINRFMKQWSADYWEMFEVVIQLGAILAVVVMFWGKLFPFNLQSKKNGEPVIKKKTLSLWGKVIVGCIPAGIVGVLFDDIINATFYNALVVVIALIVYGALYIIIENRNKNRTPCVTSIYEMSYKTAFEIGFFQMLSIIPGTSRSGSTILGGMLIGTSRTVSAEFSFFLAVPVMFGASFLKLLKFGFDFEAMQVVVLLVGSLVSFIVSLVAIKFLINFVRRHNFKLFGYYRIILGALVLLYFLLSGDNLVKIL